MSESKHHLTSKWQSQSLADACDVVLGQSPPSKTYNTEQKGLPFFQGKAEFGELYPTAIKWCSDPRKIAEKDDVLVSVRAPVGPTNLCPSRACIGRGLAALRPRNGMSSRYLLYGMRATVDDLAAKATGSTFEAVSGKVLRAHTIPVAPSEEQRRIVAEIEKQFTRLDAGVAAVERAQANLKRYRASVLKAACEGRLVPTEAELAREVGRDYETGEQLLERILAERRETWQGRGKYKEPAPADTGKLPVLPDGWTWTTVDSIAFVTKLAGFEYTKYVNYVDDGDLPVLKAENAGPNGFKRTRFSTVASDSVAHLQRSKLKAGDLLMVFVGAGTGNVATVPDDQSYFLGPNIGMIRIQASGVLPRYCELYFRSPQGKALALSFSKAVAQPSLSMRTIRMIPVAIPPASEQERIVAEAERRLSVADEVQAALTANHKRAARLRQSILQKAFEGRLAASVPERTIQRDASAERPAPAKRHFRRAVLAAEIVDRLHEEPTFGRVKFQKVLHICEYVAELDDIEGQYRREAAGPLDNKLVYSCETELKRQEWFEAYPRGTVGHAYRPLQKAGGHRKYFERYWPGRRSTVEQLIEMVRSWTTEQCEIFSTTYAAWNDLLIWGHEPTNDAILTEILDRWADTKKRIPEERWRNAIEWMRDKGFAPTGFGRATVGSEDKK